MRAYDNYGVDVSYLYDPTNVLDTKKKQQQEDWLDSHSLADIANEVDRKIEEIKGQYVEDDLMMTYQAGDGALELIEDLEKNPEIGIPYVWKINQYSNKRRLRKFYLRSAATVWGRLERWWRTLVILLAPNCMMKLLDGIRMVILNLLCLLQLSRIRMKFQTMMLAFISNVNEEHILNGSYVGDERDRVIHAAQIMGQSKLWIEELPDFSLQDIENKIQERHS